jgi:hypothetical protein
MIYIHPMFLPTLSEHEAAPRQTDLKMGDDAAYPAVLLNTITPAGNQIVSSFAVLRLCPDIMVFFQQRLMAGPP